MSNQGPDSMAAAAESWSRYWASGPLHSCPNAFAGNYDDEIRDFWMSFFGRLPDGASILDIGTGNGAIAFLARDVADSLKRKFHIEGIDAAVIHPAAAAARHGIRAGDIVFRGNTCSERTGYPDGHFDAASSQYAIEYSRIDDSLAELARVLKS
jgi:ubiquinone/menaquinone biosynthesis C-methylase UbiE